MKDGRLQNELRFAGDLYPVERVWRESEKYGYINSSGGLVIDYRFDCGMFFSEGRAGIRQREKWGFIDASGRVAIQPQFEAVHLFREGNARVEVNGKNGFIDRAGRMISRRRYVYACDFQEGFAAVGNEFDSNSFINSKGQLVIARMAPKVSCKRFSEGLARMEFLFEKFLFIDREGAEVFSIAHVDRGGVARLCGDFSETLAHFMAKNRKFGYINKWGVVVISPKFEMAHPFLEGVAAVSYGGKYGLINREGEFVVSPKFHMLGHLVDGIAKAKSVRQKCGYIDKNGETVIPFVFDSVSDFQNQLAAAVYKGRSVYVNRTAMIVWPEGHRMQL